MRIGRICGSVILVGGVLLTAAARAADDGVAAESIGEETQDQQLHVGDWYEVRVTHHGAVAEAQGQLLKVTDDWVVLGVLRSEAATKAVPVLGQMPLIGRMFRQTEPCLSKSYDWIPRQSITIVKHNNQSEITDPTLKDLFKGEEPTMKGITRVTWIDAADDKADSALRTADLKSIDKNQFIVMDRVEETRKDSHGKDVKTVHTAEKHLTAADVWFIDTQVKYDPPVVLGKPAAKR